MKAMHIGEIARQFGLNPRTIRYYETIDVLPAAARTESGYRIYSQEAVERLEFVLKAKALGLTLNEIQKILSLHDEGVVPCEHTRDFIRNKLNEIDKKMAALASLKKTLSSVLKTGFKKHAAASFCPLIEEAGKNDKKPLTMNSQENLQILATISLAGFILVFLAGLAMAFNPRSLMIVPIIERVNARKTSDMNVGR